MIKYIIMATWNVRTMMQLGIMQEIARGCDRRSKKNVDGWRRREIGTSGDGSMRRPRPTQGCSAKKMYS
jgi:hypothetical protein